MGISQAPKKLYIWQLTELLKEKGFMCSEMHSNEGLGEVYPLVGATTVDKKRGKKL